MSEIIAAVYDAIEQTGHREGILFLDEINCVSETLTPAMLQFLQYKVFGRHKVPEGWIVVTAGNPPEYNRTARDFDLATWDRLKRLDVEPDFQAWRDYALGHGVHPAVITYLDVEQDHFYHLETTPDGKEFVTARGWDDLSSAIRLYEAQDLPVDEVLIGQYVQAPQIAKRFAVYYDLFTKYRADYQVDRVLAGTAGPEVVERAQAAPFDERVSVVGLLSDALAGVLREAVLEEGAVEFAHPRLCGHARQARGRRRSRRHRGGARAGNRGAPSAAYRPRKRAFVRAEVSLLRARHRHAATGAAPGSANRGRLRSTRSRKRSPRCSAGLRAASSRASRHLTGALAFAEQAFGEGQEMLLLITDLSANRYSMAFINAHGSERFFKHNSALLFGDRGADLAARIKQTALDEE